MKGYKNYLKAELHRLMELYDYINNFRFNGYDGRLVNYIQKLILDRTVIIWDEIFKYNLDRDWGEL